MKPLCVELLRSCLWAPQRWEIVDAPSPTLFVESRREGGRVKLEFDPGTSLQVTQ